MQKMFVLAAAMLAALAFVAPAQAAQITYHATLSGARDPTNTGSAATGAGTVVVDTDAQTIDATIEIHGITFAELSQHLAHSRMGPIHLHQYHANGDVDLIVPFPFGDSYAETADGFTVTVHNYRYADGQTALGANIPFESFLASLADGKILLNIHTQRFGDGEISGYLVPST